MDIAAICAPPPHYNAGMASVDMALADLAARRNLSVTFYRLLNRPAAYSGETGIQYHDAVEHWRAITQADRILYWGDFHHMKTYVERVSRRLLHSGYAPDTRSAMLLSRRSLLMSGESKLTKAKVVSFGGTLLQNNSNSYANSPYRTEIAELIASARGWWVRDPFSAMDVKAFQTAGTAAWPLAHDCAFLLRDWPIATTTDKDESSTGNRAGVFLGRSSNSDSIRMMEFALELCKRADAEPVWISWLARGGSAQNTGFRRRFRDVLGVATEASEPLQVLLRLVQECRWVITDTYHLALNSWRLGTPAVCFGNQVNASGYDVSSGVRFFSRDKRFVLYSMYGLEHFFIPAHELKPRRSRHARLLWTEESLRSQMGVPERASYFFRQFVDESEASLMQTLS
jgi:hypothetical protein